MTASHGLQTPGPGIDSCVDLLLRIGACPRPGDGYPVEAWINGEGPVARGTLAGESALRQESGLDAVSYGTSLFYALFSGDLRGAYDRALGLADSGTGGQLRLRLWIDATAGELQSLAWEQMHTLRAGHAVPLATIAHQTFSRYQPGPGAGGVPPATGTLRMLFVVANPTDLVRYGLTPLDADAEVRHLAETLGNLGRGMRLCVTVLAGTPAGVPDNLETPGLSPDTSRMLSALGWDMRKGPATLPAVLRALGEDPEYQIVHFLGHGDFSRRDGEGRLYFELDDGAADPTTGSALAAGLSALARQPALMILAACNSARRDAVLEGNALVGIAPKLVAAGVTAVVAMQDEIPLAVARAFTTDITRDILTHGVVDRAVSRARMLLQQAKSPAWAVPVLVTSRMDNRLFAPDPVQALLQALVASTNLTPFGDAHDYIPLEVVHTAGADGIGKAVQDPSWVHGLVPRARSDAVDAVSAIYCLPDGSTRIVALDGGLGSGKSVLLRWIGRQTALASLGACDVVIPILLDFQRDLGPVYGASDLVQLVLDVLQPYWPDLDFDQMVELLELPTGPRFRLLVDGLEQRAGEERGSALQALSAFARIFPRQQMIIACAPSAGAAGDVPVTDVLTVQPIGRRAISAYLADRGQAGLDLLDTLGYIEAFDLASQPWVLVKLLALADRGRFPASRLSVVEEILHDEVAAITDDATMQRRVLETLAALAWTIARSLRPAISVDAAFKLMASVRGARDYDLETLLRSLVARGVLVACGNDSLRFGRPAIQAACAARGLAAASDRQRQLDDIAATLGRRTRLYWWWDVLLFYAGLSESPIELIRQVLFGAPAGGDPFLLAARMIREVGWPSVPASIVDYVVRSLSLQLDPTRESRAWRRAEVVQALAQVPHPAVERRLVQICLEPVPGTAADRGYEHSSVRLAAFLSLTRRAESPVDPPGLGAAASTDGAQSALEGTVLSEVLALWRTEDIPALSQLLVDLEAEGGDPDREVPIVAFALASLETTAALEVLVQLFFSARDIRRTGPSLATALGLMDAGTVTRRVILPVIDAEACVAQGLPPAVCADPSPWVPAVVGLAGQLRTADPRVLAFLRRTLVESSSATLVALAIEALGQAGDVPSRALLEAVALGDFVLLRGLQPSAGARELEATQRVTLQMRAVEALARVGDADTLRMLQTDAELWVSGLEMALTATCEEIIWREIITFREDTV